MSHNFQLPNMKEIGRDLHDLFMYKKFIHVYGINIITIGLSQFFDGIIENLSEKCFCGEISIFWAAYKNL